MLQGNSPLVHAAKWVAAVTALVIAVGTPVGYLSFGYRQQDVATSTKVDFMARQISQLIGNNPVYWQFEGIRIGELLQNPNDDPTRILHRVFDQNGDVVVQYPASAPRFHWPVMVRKRDLFDYGEVVGQIEVTQSLQSLYSRTALVTVFSILAGLLIFWVLRVLPMRALMRAWDRVAYLASHDALTGLPNRTLFLDRLHHILANAPRQRDTITVHSIDLDHFKDVNDTLGHAAGDAVLRQAAQRMQSKLRPGDTLARFGGDEFAIIQSGTNEPEKAAAVAEKIIAALTEPFDLDGRQALLGVSIGMATYTPEKPLSADQLLKHADLALYKSKNSGRGTFHFFHEKMDAELQSRKAMEIELRTALHNHQFELHYQPQVDLSSQRIVGLEALIRWNHPRRGEIQPLDFLPIAERTGLIRPLSEWVLRTACREALKWDPLRIAINLSPSQIQQENIVEMVKSALAESGLPAHRLELEITENGLIDNTQRTLDVLNGLRKLGIRIAMDDFGTGYSSLGYLRRFPFDKIKIDRSFISDLGQDGNAQAIVRAIVALSRALGIQINAEGVETIEQAQALLGEGCEEVQGFLYGRPMPEKDMQELLVRSHVLTTSTDPADLSPLISRRA